MQWHFGYKKAQDLLNPSSNVLKVSIWSGPKKTFLTHQGLLKKIDSLDYIKEVDYFSE